MGNDTVIFMYRFDGVDEKVYEHNFQSFVQNNPGIDVLRFNHTETTDPHWNRIKDKKRVARRNRDLVIYDFYRQHPSYKNYVYAEWDTFCNIDMRKLIAPAEPAKMASMALRHSGIGPLSAFFEKCMSNLTPELKRISVMPTPLCGTYFNNEVLNKLSAKTELHERDMWYELRVGLLARLNGIEPTVYPLCSKTLDGQLAAISSDRMINQGLFHPIKQRVVLPAAPVPNCPVVGSWQGSHPHWSATIKLASDGRLYRWDRDDGWWHFFPDGELGLFWTGYPPEKLQLTTHGFEARDFNLVQQECIPAELVVEDKPETIELYTKDLPFVKTSMIVTVDQHVELLPHFLNYYRKMGVERFLVGIHYITQQAEVEKYVSTLGKDVFVAAKQLVYSLDGVFMEEDIRRTTDSNWFLIADLDEFQEYPIALSDLIEKMEMNNTNCIWGRLIDRLTNDGRLPAKLSETEDILAQFPTPALVESTLTPELCQTKVMLVNKEPTLAGGYHSCTNGRPDQMKGFAWHVKWFGPFVERLKRRNLDNLNLGWSRFAACNRKLLAHVAINNGINVTNLHASPIYDGKFTGRMLGKHSAWTSEMFLTDDGYILGCDGGTWLRKGNVLILNWKHFFPEALTIIDATVARTPSFTLTRL